MTISRKRFDAFVLIFLLIISIVYALALQGTFLGKPLIIGVVLFLVPTVYLWIRRKKNWKQIGAGTIVFGFLFYTLLEHIDGYGHWTDYSGASYQLVFAKQEYFIVHLLAMNILTLLVLTVYEHFINIKENLRINQQGWYAMLIAIVYGLSGSWYVANYGLPPFPVVAFMATIPLISAVLLRRKFLLKLLSGHFCFVFVYLTLVCIAIYVLFFARNGIYIAFEAERGRCGGRAGVWPLFSIMILYISTIVCYLEMTSDSDD